ncbi:MAG: Type II secretion system protein E [Parcubacteria group bacterium GW2011_GWA2_47_9]|nr:MAG: Type II secretion system protein E [Parcubacteria group bacterium GW2011_GWA2_47_9]
MLRSRFLNRKAVRPQRSNQKFIISHMAKLLQQLIQAGVLPKEKGAQLEQEIKKSGAKEEDTLLAQKIITEEKLFELKAKDLRLPLKQVIPEDIPLELLGLIPEEAAKYYKMIPIGKAGNVVEIGMVYPDDFQAQEALKFMARQGGFKYEAALITPTNFQDVAKRYRTFKGEVTKALGELEEEVKQEKKKAIGKTSDALERLVEDAPITRVVAVLLRHAVEGDASDIHIEPTRKELRVRMRQDGILKTRLILPLKTLPAVVARIKILSNLRIDETRIPQDGRFTTKIDEQDIDFRVSTLPTVMGEKVAIRILDPATGLKGLADLGLVGHNLKVTQETLKQPFGLILSTGPTGSGKTTSLYAALQILNKESQNILTLEDPIEYFIDGVNQSQVRPEIGYDFASGLRSMLRQDPNVIMVGEIRDSETAGLAIHAALTGHVVLSTLHTNNAIGVIPRLIDLGAAPYLLPPTLRLAIAQRLVRRLCASCKKKAKPSKEEADMLLKELQGLPQFSQKNIKSDSMETYIPVGCRKCRLTGYSGRIGIFEVLEISGAIAQIIAKKPAESEIEKLAKEQGMITMRQDGMLKALEGLTSIAEIVSITEEQK